MTRSVVATSSFRRAAGLAGAGSSNTQPNMHAMAPPGALYQFTIVHEALVNFGNAHAALGMAQMNALGDHPTIFNIGSFGNAGAAAPKMWAARTAL